MPLLSLPLDILERILCFPVTTDIIACRITRRSMQHFIDTSLPIRYIIALSAREMREGPNTTASLAERLESLNKYELAWRNLSWKESLHFDFPDSRRPLYTADGYLLIVHPGDYVKVTRLPSPLRGVERKEYEWAAPSGFFKSHRLVIMDPHHDLMII